LSGRKTTGGERMKEIEDWIKITKEQIQEGSDLDCLLWDIRENKNLLEDFVREIEDLEEEVEDKLKDLEQKE
jgi:hypothetical protein